MLSGDSWDDNWRLLGWLNDYRWNDKWQLLGYLTTLGMMSGDSYDNWPFLGWWGAIVEIIKLRNERDEYGSGCVAEFRVLSRVRLKGLKKPTNHVRVSRPRFEHVRSVTDWTNCTEITFCNVAVGNNEGNKVGLHPKLTLPTTSVWNTIVN
jgi:hypothetical protein